MSDAFPLARPAPGLVGRSPAMLAVLGKIAVYGPADAPVLVTGETGTGKELVARALHAASARRNRPFLAMNCSALNEELFESELFGHERGAFTGAHAVHRGRFERADGGTLFLDEVGDVPPRAQAKLLRVLEDGSFERVGGEKEMRADVRIVAATNRPLERGVADRWFRDDLFHRLAVLRIHTPPLRERLEDLPFLVEHFLGILNARYGKIVRRVTPEGLRALAAYPWPGNIRELRNVLERVHVEAQTDVLGRNAFLEWESERANLAAGAWNVGLRDEQRLSGGFVPPAHAELTSRPEPALRDASYPGAPLLDLPGTRVVDLAAGPTGWSATPTGGPAAPPPALPPAPAELTESAIRSAFAAARGNATRAAAALGVHKATLYRRMKGLGLRREDLTTS